MTPSQPSRRLRIAYVSYAWLKEFLSLDGAKLVKVVGLPADAKIVGVSTDSRFDCDQISIKVESESFDEVTSGYPVPELTLTWAERWPDEREGRR